MRVANGLKTIVLGSLLCAGCPEDDPNVYTPPPDSGSVPVVDSGSGAKDAGTSSDSGSSDAGASDSGSSDSGSSDGGSDSDAGVLASGMGTWTVYDNPYMDGGANPAMGIMGSALAVKAGDGGMTVTLNVTGLLAARGYGSHVHKLECPPPSSAGGHFQHDPAPDGGANDPMFANPMNEVWLDFTTDDAGAGKGSATVDFVPPAGGAKAIVVHDKLTGDGGLAGPKLACLPFVF